LQKLKYFLLLQSQLLSSYYFWLKHLGQFCYIVPKSTNVFPTSSQVCFSQHSRTLISSVSPAPNELFGCKNSKRQSVSAHARKLNRWLITHTDRSLIISLLCVVSTPSQSRTSACVLSRRWPSKIDERSQEKQQVAFPTFTSTQTHTAAAKRASDKKQWMPRAAAIALHKWAGK